MYCDNFPVVSIIIPCYNEEDFIGPCLESVMQQDYPKDKVEVLVVDGMSQDGTKALVKRFMKEYSNVKLLDNTLRTAPIAFNMGIKNSKGSIIMIMGAHAEYENNYVSKCIACLDESKADNVGGMIITLPDKDTFVGKCIVLVLASYFGVGNSDYKINLSENKYVDTVFGGCYRKEIFDKIGYFNEKLTKSQDMEFNIRLKKAGGRIFFNPRIVCRYYVRTNFSFFCRRNFRNGIWAVMPFKYTQVMPVSPRHLVPFVFVSGVMLSAMLSFIFPMFRWIFTAIVSSYCVTNLYFSVKIASQQRDLRYFILVPGIFAVLHVSYGLGSLWGFMAVSLYSQFWKNIGNIVKEMLPDYGMKNITDTI